MFPAPILPASCFLIAARLPNLLFGQSQMPGPHGGFESAFGGTLWLTVDEYTGFCRNALGSPPGWDRIGRS
jgi:hypothetical protein